MSSSKKILFVVNSASIGGAERHTFSLLDGLVRKGWDARIFILQRANPELPELTRFDAELIRRANFGGGWDPRGAIDLGRLIGNYSPDLIYCANTYPLAVSQLAKALSRMRVPIVMSFHTTELLDSKARRHFYMIYRRLMNRVSRVVYVCDAQKSYWLDKGLRADRATVIHNGIDEKFLDYQASTPARNRIRNLVGASDTDIVVGLCAALRPEKAHKDMVEAIFRLRTQGQPFKAIFIGDGPCRADLEKLIYERRLQTEVQITGAQSDVRPYIAACDVMALVSHSVETFSIASLESMALGKPVILSDIGGAREQVIPGVNGFLYPRGDVDALVDRLRRLQDQYVRSRMGDSGRKLIREKFLVNKMLEKYESLFEQIIS